ncbi:hypothetical protein CRYUN_Cryun03dG0071700 [Craigia yunnanensis]
MAKSNRLVLVALHQILKKSFGLYVEICEALGILLYRFTKMEYVDCVKGFDAYVSAAKMIDELVGFYGWCKDMGIARSFEYTEMQIITNKLLRTLEGFLKEMANRPKSPERSREEKPPVKEETEANMNEIKDLPAPENYSPPPSPPEPEQPKSQRQQVTEDLVNLKDDAVSADEQGNKLALALFS